LYDVLDQDDADTAWAGDEEEKNNIFPETRRIAGRLMEW
jgi:hypothetical protein